MLKSLQSIVVASVFVICTVSPAYTEIRNPEEHFFHQSFGDLQEEAEIAKEEGQVSILVMFELNDCPWCERMKNMILNQSEVQDYYREHFRILMMNVEGDNLIIDFNGEEIAEKDFALKHNRIRATPVFLFLDLEGTRIARYTGAAKDVEEFLLLGEFVSGGYYEDTNFVKFKRARLKSGS